MNRRIGELVLVLIAVALGVYAVRFRPTKPQPSGYVSDGPPLTFNGVKPGDAIADLERRLGRPNFKNAGARYQQWEQPLTQLNYSEQGLVTGVGGSGTGVLCQGDRTLLRCGFASEKDILSIFGPPPGGPKDKFYRYPGLRCAGSGVDLTIHCGSESLGVLSVSHIQLGKE